ncbi:hypothetical protein VaNZ11_006192 [Volvox africanus]|uniref:1-phosphatidylinositol 4-kinase n=1 Tax=Volvox africanus TaxID=51714 RepID=A0ABQ5S0A4_9CHLO|nr:hypothetical protein VaNZ11_006192 [Volvox africanus]
MSMISLLELRSSWAQSLASINPVDEEKVALLLRLCAQQPVSDEKNVSLGSSSARNVATNILPLVGFIDKSGGKRVDAIMPEVIRQLPLLATRWTEPCADSSALAHLFEEMFTILHRVLYNKDVPVKLRKALSGVVGDLLAQLVKTLLHMPTDVPAGAAAAAAGGGALVQPTAPAQQQQQQPAPLPGTSPAQLIMRALTRSQAFAVGAGVPLLPAEAKVLLSWMVENVLPAGGKPASSSAMAPAPGTRAGVGAAVGGDEKLLLLMAQLVRTMLMGQRDSTAGDGATALGGVGSANLQENERQLLTTVLTWSMGLVRGVMTKLLQPVTGLEVLSSTLLAGKQLPAAPAQPQTAGAIRAAARLAATAMHGLLLRSVGTAAVGGPSPAGVLTPAARTQLMDVISMLLDMSESCVSLAMVVGSKMAGADKVLDMAAYILEDCSSLIITGAREAATFSTASAAPLTNGTAGPKLHPSTPAAVTSLDVGTIFSRLKAILLAAAALVDYESGTDAKANWRNYWSWDVSRPLTASYVRGSRMPGWGAQRLCCNVAETLVCGLAASYHAGMPTYARALLLLPLSLPDTGLTAVGGNNADAGAGAGVSGRDANEALVLSLAMGRLFVLLRGDEELACSMVPLLTDVLAQPATSPAAVSLQASVVQALAAIAANSVTSERAVTWAYNQITDVLLRLLLEARHPGAAAAALAATAEGPGAEALSNGLLKLAKGIRHAPSVARRDLRNRLLVQFSELGLRAGSFNRDHDSVRAEMGRLLPAIAEACEGLESSALSASRFSMGSLAAQQQLNNGSAAKADLHMIRLLRNLWLYVALFGLSSSKGASPEQLDAAGRIAAWTPVLMLAEAGASETDMTEQLKAELGERLRLAGDALASPARLRSSLQSLLDVPLGGAPQPPPDANLQAYLLAVATAEVCRVKYAPLKADATASPISVALTYLQAADPVSSEAAWYAKIAKKAFEVYLGRLREETSRPSSSTATTASPTDDGIAAGVAAEEDHRRASSYPSGRNPSYAGLSFIARNRDANGVPNSVVADLAWPGEATNNTGGAASAAPVVVRDIDGGDDAANGRAASERASGLARVSERCLEILAVSLIRHLGSAGGHEEGVAPQVATVSGLLLRDLLDTYQPVYWSYACMEALLSELDSEESLDHPLSEVHGANNLSAQAAQGTASMVLAPGMGGTVWRWLHTWVLEAARIAPARTEALLRLFLDETSISSHALEGDAAEGAVGALDGLAPPLSLSSSANSRARAAALRRDNDLMVVTAEARRQAPVGAGAGGAGSGTDALRKKLFFSGVIAGVQHITGGHAAGPGAVAELTLSGLEEGLAAARHNFPLLRQRYLGAAAFLARRAAEDGEEESLAGSVVHSVCYRVLQQLCMAPLRRFRPEMMYLATFAWTWISTAGPSWLVPLVSRAAAAWSATVDRGMGLFDGAWGKKVIAHNHAASSVAAAEDVHIADDDGAAEWELLKGLSCHHQWIAFLYEMWASAGDRTDAERRALTSVYDRLLHHSLLAPEERLCSHPAAVAPLFRLLQLTLSYLERASRSRPWGPPQALLFDRVLRAGLIWFSHPVAFTARISQGEAEEQHRAVADFVTILEPMLKNPPPAAPVAGPVYSAKRHGRCAMDPAAWSSRPSVSEAVWGPAAKGLRMSDAAALLLLLCRAEIARLREWSRPRMGPTVAPGAPPLTAAHVQTAWKVSPQLAVAILQRFPTPLNGGASEAQRALTELVLAAAADPRVQALPDAAMVLATDEAARARKPQLAALATWAPASAVQGLQLMCGPAQHHKGIKAYALRCLRAASPAKVVFFLPQLVQALRSDGDVDNARSWGGGGHKGKGADEDTQDGATGQYLLATAARDDKFAHQLMWALATEEKPPPEEFTPEIKRSGWEPPKDTGLWDPAEKLKRKVLAQMTPEQRAYWEAEDGYFNKVTSISGILKKLEPDARRAKIKRELEAFGPTRADLYVPTNPDCDVLGHIPESGAPMQSAAKVPILVKFKVAHNQPPPLPPLNREVACIFKVGDDCRQDVLALQAITILRDAFQKAGLELYLRPYGCIPTGYGRGIIEVVPKTQSRAAMGELAERGLYEIFVSQFGPPNGDRFKAAQRNFITSEAGYAVASYLLQAKDRHNGNLLIDSEGHLVHIDFGFIMDISPGHNMGFESAAFKMSHEMTQLLDPGGKRNSESYMRFQEAVVRGYLVARTVAEPIIASVALMAESGLPCFGYGKPLVNLRKRFHLEMTDAQASAYMRMLISDSYDKWTTGFYDFIQNMQNRIPY